MALSGAAAESEGGVAVPGQILDRLRAAMRQAGLSAVALIAPENVCWTAGVMVPSQKVVRHRHAIVLVPQASDPEIIVVNVEEGYVRSRAEIKQVTAYNEFTQKPVVLLAEAIRRRGLRGAVGVESTYLNHADYRLLEQCLEGMAQLQPVDELVEQLRMIKVPEEIECLTRAGRIAEQTAYESLQTWWPGMTEADLAGIITERFKALGGEQLTMLSVTAGERTPMLNGTPTAREIRPGDVVRIDVIGTVGNYYCDVARTAVVGEPTPELQSIWRKLVDCRDMALEMIRPGASAHAIFKAYIERMDRWGFPTLHFLGHGLGLTLHEQPYLNRYSDCVLEEGMVLALEPLVVFPQLGMQLEEAVVVTRNGCEVITNRYDTCELWEMYQGEKP